MDIQELLLKRFGYDKIAHFLGGGWVACFAPSWYWAIIIAIIIGFLKESLIDVLIRKTIFDWHDWIATTFGGVITAIFMFFGLL